MAESLLSLGKFFNIKRMKAEERLAKKAGAKIEKAVIGGREINFVVAGKGRRVVLLLHGANIGWGMWWRNIAFLAKRFSVYAFDFPGSGHSEGIDFSKVDLGRCFVDSACDFIKMKKLRSVRVVGHSLGGWVAIKLVLQNRFVKEAVAVNPVGFCAKVPAMYKPISFYPLAKLLTKTVMKPTRENMEKFLKGAVFSGNKVAREFAEYMGEVYESGTPSPLLLMSRISGWREVNREFMLTEGEVEKIGKRVLIIVGEKDPLTPVQELTEMVESNEKIKVYVVRKSAHLPMMEKEGEFNSLLGGFLAE